jgi:hypothetical protein
MVTAFFYGILKISRFFYLAVTKFPLILSVAEGQGAEGVWVFTAPDHTHALPRDGIYQLFLVLARNL